MNDIFKLDAPIFTILSKFCDLLILSVLWTIFSIPLITIGPASSALYHTVHKCFFHNEGYVASTFWKSFKTNLKQGVLLTLICLPIAFFAFVSYNFSKSMGHASLLGVLYLVVCLFCILFLLTIFTYGFPTLSRFYMKTSDVVKTSVAFAITRAGFSILLFLIFGICAIAFYIAPVTCFLLPACYAMAAERLLEPAFKKALDALDEANDDKKNTEEIIEAQD